MPRQFDQLRAPSDSPAPLAAAWRPGWSEGCPATSLMISALVTYLDANDAGSGFYGYAQDLGMLPRNASAMQKLEFWARQVKALHKAYAARRPG